VCFFSGGSSYNIAWTACLIYEISLEQGKISVILVGYFVAINSNQADLSK
jgi:hypothetical protein